MPQIRESERERTTTVAIRGRYARLDHCGLDLTSFPLTAICHLLVQKWYVRHSSAGGNCINSGARSHVEPSCTPQPTSLRCRPVPLPFPIDSPLRHFIYWSLSDTVPAVLSRTRTFLPPPSTYLSPYSVRRNLATTLYVSSPASSQYDSAARSQLVRSQPCPDRRCIRSFDVKRQALNMCVLAKYDRFGCKHESGGAQCG